MDEKHKKIICLHLVDLVNTTNHLDNILKRLLEFEVLNEYMVKHLNKYHELRRKLREFYYMMLGRGPKAFDYLVVALRETGNFRAEQILYSYKVTFNEVPRQREPENLTIDELDIGSSDSEKDVEIIVKKHPEEKFMDIDDNGQAVGAYRMRSNPRGYALIINIFETVGKDDRLGSDIDHYKLEKLFKELGFKVFTHTNLSHKKIEKEILNLSMDPRLEQVDCLVVFIMCHGMQKESHERSSVELLASDGVTVDTNWITKQFQSNIPFISKRRKPKLFFFQACRSTNNATRDPNVRYSRNIETDSEVMSGWETNEANIHYRDYEDTFLGFSTIPGYCSMRERESGGWFVDAFCDVVAEHAWKYDLDAMWAMIDDKIREKRSARGGQTPELVKRGFNKKLFFNPHLYET